jgi:hypothetical protein
MVGSVSEVPTWGQARTSIDRVVAASTEPFEVATIANCHDLLDFLLPHCAPPFVGQGYWPTFQISWDGWKLSLEVFADRIEVYPPSEDRKTVNVWYEPHTPGGGFSEAFVAEILAHAPSRSAGFLKRIRQEMAGTVTIPPGVDVTEPTGEIWDAERD